MNLAYIWTCCLDTGLAAVLANPLLAALKPGTGTSLALFVLAMEQTNGILSLENMEHADDVMLELAGICSRDRVTVGGIVDTRNPKKPLSTNVQVTGRTFEGKISTHTFTLGDETSMAANVCGPAFGYLKAGLSLHKRGLYGLFTAAEVMPKFVR